MAIQPNYPMVNLGNLYVQGGHLAYATTTTFTVAAGQFRDSTNTNDIVIPATTVSIASTGLNGLDVGTIAASSIYYVYAIGSSVYGANNGQDENASQGVGIIAGTNIAVSPSYPDSYVPAGILISLAAPSVGPALPVNYDMYRRIGAIRTTAGSVIEPFVQSGLGQNRTMRYMTPVAPGSAATSATTTYATIGVLTAIVPQVTVDVIVNSSLVVTNAGDALFLAPYGNTVAPGGYMVRAFGGAVDATPAYMQLVCPCAFNAAATPIVEVDYATTAGAGDAVTFTVAGYVDSL